MIRVRPSLSQSRASQSPAHAIGGIRAVLHLLPLLYVLTVGAGVALAQHAADAGTAPPPPPGPGRLTVQIVGSSDAESFEGLSIALYALAPDGTPGLTNGLTDAEGRVVFSGISNDPEIVYLVGARYAEIPFGERVAFAPDVTEALVEVRVSSPTDRVSGVRVEELRARVDWMGDRIVVTEILRFSSTGDRVIQLESGNPGQAIAQRPLPPEAGDFSTGPSSFGDGLALEDGRVSFWGPLYPGEQRVEYSYSLPVSFASSPSSEDRTLQLPVELGETLRRIVIVAGTSGIEVEGPSLVASQNVTSDSGQPLSAWARGPLRAGERIDVTLTLPESRFDSMALTIPRTDVWVDLDDTRLNANVDLQLQVEPGAPIAGTAQAPLMHVSIPTGASLEGVSPDAESMGLVPTEDGGFDVIGPIAPGEHSLGYAYRLPSRPEGVALDMRFPREVATLNVLIADSGLALDSSRLHRRRPFRNGTRNYLHREAFNVSPDETVDLTLEPLRGQGLTKQSSQALAVLGAAAAGLFLVAPLRRSIRREEREDSEVIRIREEREAVYTAIADLDHDYETGKLDESDYAEMRDDLRSRAIELLRSERATEDGGTPGSASDQGSAPTATHSRSPESVGSPATGGFCPGCGGQVDARWQYCSHCGGSLNPSSEPSSEPGSAPSAGEEVG